MSSGFGIRSNMLRVKFCPGVQKRPLNGEKLREKMGKAMGLNFLTLDTGIKIEVCLKINNLYK